MKKLQKLSQDSYFFVCLDFRFLILFLCICFVTFPRPSKQVEARRGESEATKERRKETQARRRETKEKSLHKRGSKYT